MLIFKKINLSLRNRCPIKCLIDKIKNEWLILNTRKEITIKEIIISYKNLIK